MSSASNKSSKSGFMVFVIKMAAKFAPGAVKLLKLLKVGKLSLAALSIGAYSVIFTWQFALVIISMLVIHEYGHLGVMKHYHMRTRGMYIIPFLGAAAVADEEFPDRKSEAVIAIAGPLVGGALAVISGMLYYLTANPYFAAVCSWMALINLFNLIPVSPLDGGRVLKSVTFSISSRIGLGFMIVAMLAASVFAFQAQLVIFVILIPIGVIEFLSERRHARHHAPIKPIMAPAMVRLMFSGYLVLAAFLWMLMLVMSHEPGAAAAMHALQG